MKLYNFYTPDGKFVERKKCSQREAEVYANNFNFKFEEYKRNGK